MKGPGGVRVAVLAALLSSAGPGFAATYRDSPEDEGQGSGDRPGEDDRALPRAGGLAPPHGDFDADRGPSETERDLDEADRKDARRGLELVWGSLEAGYGGMGWPGAFLPTGPQGGPGFAFGGGAGLRFLYLTVGARFRFQTTTAFDFWSIAPELGFRLPLGNWEPFVSVACGYGEALRVASESAAFRVDGFVVRPALGLDYFLGPAFSLGVEAALDLAWATRAPKSGQPAAPFEQVGNAMGVGGGGLLRAGFHF